MEEARQRVKQAGYTDTDLEAYITYIKRWDKAADVYRYNPYMTVDGRVKEAKEANETFSVRTYFNTGMEDIRVHLAGSPEAMYPILVLPARCCVAIFTDQSGHVHMGTASIGTEGMVDRTNPLENAETSAVGRALGLAGYGLIPGAGIASAEEMGEAFTRQRQNDAPAGPEELGSYRVRAAGWGRERKYGGMTLEEVYEDPDGFGAMAWAAGLDDASGDTKKMAQYFNLRETQKEEAEGIYSVPDGMSLEEYDRQTTDTEEPMVEIAGRKVRAKSTLSPEWTNHVQQLLSRNVGPDKLFGHNNHVINHLKSHYKQAKVIDLTGEQAAALVRYIESNGQDADPRWYAEPGGPTPTEELFGQESIEDLLKKAAEHLPEAWKDKPEKWWAKLLEQYSIGTLSAKQLRGARVVLLAVASGNINWDDTESASFKIFQAGMESMAVDG